MLKKMIAIGCSMMIVFSMAACKTNTGANVSASSEEFYQSSVETSTPVLSQREEQKNAILENVDLAYTGEMSLDATMYFTVGEEGKYVALMLVEESAKEYVKFIGNGTLDENTGLITVTDDETGYSFGFTATKEDDGSFLLDCGNLGEATLQLENSEDVVEQMITAIETMDNVTDVFVEEVSKFGLESSEYMAFSGVTSHDSPMYFLVSGDGTSAAVVIVASNYSGYIQFVGEAQFDEKTGVTTIIDEEKGYRFGFIAKEQEDGTYYLDCGNIGDCSMEKADFEEVNAQIGTIFTDFEDATDQFMESISE